MSERQRANQETELPRAGSGWRPLSDPSRATGLVASPFTRLARAHALSVAGDTLIALALADSLFFSIDPDAARWRVALYLGLTMAPFAVVAPLIGPAIDRARGGRRLMVIGSAVGRALVCVFMIDDLNGLLLFPEAFVALVLQKGYAVARSALVPGLVRSDAELVEANSKLSLISAVVGFAAAAPGIAVLQLFGAKWVLGLAVAVFLIGATVGFRIPRTAVAESPPDEAERAELRSLGIVLAAGSMALLRAIVGFLTFLLAFALRNSDAPTWWFGLVIAASMIGMFLGAVVAPPLRRATREEHMLAGTVFVVVVAAAACAFIGGRPSWAALAAAVGLANGAAKLAFDAIVQRDAPDANQGRSFARFEARFQIVWVAGALLPVAFPIPARVGFVLIAAVAGFAGVTYVAGLRSHRLQRPGTGGPLARLFSE